ncbi:MAG: ABC transporter ATP-binding protein [Mycobacteriales bacterium]|nr:ABC transporter ATP-binding protein [Frankia sp.]
MTAARQATRSGDVVLDVADVTLRFGGLTGLDDVTLQQQRGEILAVIGPNGAGKTSLFNCLTGVYRPQEGRITFRPDADGAPHSLLSVPRNPPLNLLGLHRPPTPYQVCALGIARTFQNIRLFAALTALENVKVGYESRQRTGPFGAILRLPRTRREERESDAKAFELLDFVGLKRRANELAGNLAYGDQRRLEIARALATAPALLLLDEPAAGTNPVEKRQLEQLIRRVNDTGTSVLLIEHDMRLVMSIAERVVVLNFGKVIATGSPSEVQGDSAVIEAYLGSEATHAAGA